MNYEEDGLEERGIIKLDRNQNNMSRFGQMVILEVEEL